MGIELHSLRELDTEAVLASEQLLSTLLAAYAPDIDTTGALRQLVIRPNALLYMAARTEVDRLRRSSSLYALAHDPDLADPEVMDAALSNYGIRRREGTRAMVTFIKYRHHLTGDGKHSCCLLRAVYSVRACAHAPG